MDDLRLMRKHSPPHVQVKAAGGVRDLDRLLEVRAIGVTRFGCHANPGDARRVQAASGHGVRDSFSSDRRHPIPA